ncbi:aldehyde dehydrogenase family protein [Roseobacter denitrificans]|uniref:aldehyde dehydrogenase (NAD(+)) n=1 Tax=Roseobacter denitrificans (strain ATCC 33942 / OCh 114) TaxID=375451 RepID=Q16CG0_ROSDO|nr:aldehyde dehydrogenase family protein [Roseobacter denitrificans]ABG30333.1 aldehyde dehydrogenase family protein, putative [Roseobacter denitrificans OCh 114]AVL53499.1 aldehyde dehydrogenase family protein [Roseobacter denitrificans]SFF71703.1 aldehyde dehydrogenase (NAD+) [Roseobacter denitrificans OCh 114]
MLEKRNFYINGQWVAPVKQNDFAVIDPSTEEQCAVISLGGQADTDAAVAAARAAFDDWSQTSKSERQGLLKRLLEVYNDRSEEMAQAMSMEMGAPMALSRAQQVGAGSWHLEGFLKAFEDFSFERDFTSSEKTLLEPIGVCALITPWNWPMNQIVLKAVPAMATGCTMILKPSEIAPLSGLLFSEFVHEAGFPAGVFNMVNGDGAGVGSKLSAHPEVDMVSFTGSTRAGIAISKAAADTLKRVSLELGGKGANIIFEDARPDAAKSGAVRCFRNSGQSCNAPTRMLVHKSRYDEAVEMAADVARNTHVGPASEEGKHIGPVVSEAQFDKIQKLIEVGMGEARLVAGGLGRPDGLNRGYFVKPTVFADVTNEMTIAREEIFGPVLSIIPFESEEEAIAIANDTPYGLTNYIQTEDTDKRRRVARRLRSGMVETNGQGFAQGSPFGGYKQSGNGREGGIYGLEEFLEVKAVSGWAAE